MNKSEQVTHLIDAHLGGRTGAAEKLGVKPATIDTWKWRGFIPRRYWKAVRAIVPEVTVEQLAGDLR